MAALSESLGPHGHVTAPYPLRRASGSDITDAHLVIPSPNDLAGASGTNAGLKHEFARAKKDVRGPYQRACVGDIQDLAAECTMPAIEHDQPDFEYTPARTVTPIQGTSAGSARRSERIDDTDRRLGLSRFLD